MPFISAGDGDLKSAFITDAWLIDQFVGNRLWIWGRNSSGYLGDNTTIHRSSPVQTIARGTNWSQVALGNFPTAGIKTDGTLWLWGGNNFYGHIGDNTTFPDRSSPVQTVTFATNWKQISCGYRFAAAVKTDGTLWAWGQNTHGTLGDDTRIHRSSPVQTVTFATNWKQVSCGYKNAAAIKTDGTLWIWGNNSYGQLGDNTIIHRSSPVQTVAGGTNWSQVSLGNYHAAAIKTDGTLWMWGMNAFGQLANLLSRRSSPIQTIAGGTNWKQVACGTDTSTAIKTDGTLWAWGFNGVGQLGDNTIISKSSPVQTVTFATNWKQVACGYRYIAAVKTDGTLWGWGQNTYGQLGDNTTIHRSSPIQTTAAGTNWKQVALGYHRTIAVTYGD